jgi:hypothetical protein
MFHNKACLVIKENLSRDANVYNKNNLCNKKTLFWLVIFIISTFQFIYQNFFKFSFSNTWGNEVKSS